MPIFDSENEDICKRYVINVREMSPFLFVCVKACTENRSRN